MDTGMDMDPRGRGEEVRKKTANRTSIRIYKMGVRNLHMAANTGVHGGERICRLAEYGKASKRRK